MLLSLSLPVVALLAGIGPLEACDDAIATLRADAADVCARIAHLPGVSRDKRLRARERLVQVHSRAGDVDVALTVATERLLLDAQPLDDGALDEATLALFARARAALDRGPSLVIDHTPPDASPEVGAARPTLDVALDDRRGVVGRVELWVQATRADGVELVQRRPMTRAGQKATATLVDPLPVGEDHRLSYRIALLTDDGLVLETDEAKIIVALGPQRPPEQEATPAPLPWPLRLAGDMALASTVVVSLGAATSVLGVAVAVGAALPLVTGGPLPLGLLGTGAAGAVGGLAVALLGAAGLAGAWGLRQWGASEG